MVGDALVNKASHLDVRGGCVNRVDIKGVGLGQVGVEAGHHTEGGHFEIFLIRVSGT
jgi:hypothetical protein